MDTAQSNFERNAPFANAGPYKTSLSEGEEAKFQQWVTTNKVPFDPGSQSDYDMRGYWKDVASKGQNETAINPVDQQLHFPDTYKTPYHESFSAESKYATADNPFKWQGETLTDTRSGTPVYQTPSAPGASAMDTEAQIDQNYAARVKRQNDLATAKAYFATHPEELPGRAAQQQQPPGVGANAGPQGPDTAAAVERSSRDPGVEAPTIDPTFVAADAMTGGVLGGVKAAIQAALESAGFQGVSGEAQQLAGKKTNSKAAQVAAGILAPIALSILAHRAVKSAPAETMESAADAAANADISPDEGASVDAAAGEKGNGGQSEAAAAVPAEVQSATTASSRAIPEDALDPATGKPLWEMSTEELKAGRAATKASEKENLVKIFGSEDAAQNYENLYRRANGSSGSADAASEQLKEIENGLTPEQQNLLYGEAGKGPPAEEDYRDYARAVNQVESTDSVDELADSLKYALPKLNSAPTDPAQMSGEQRIAYAQLRTARDVAQEKGFDLDELSRKAVDAAASRFPDSEDARSVLSRYLNPESADVLHTRANLPAASSGADMAANSATTTVAGASSPADLASRIKSAKDLIGSKLPNISEEDQDYALRTGQIPHGLSPEEEKVWQSGVDATSALEAHATAETARTLGTPEAAAQTLAQKQIEALKTAKVGSAVAEEFGKPEIATTMSNEDTLQQARDLKLNLESVYSEPVEPPELSTQTAALAKVFQSESEDLHDTATGILQRMNAGEDTTADIEALSNRFSAFAVQYAKIAGARSEMGRGLQILDPLKPENVRVTETAKLAQQLGEGNNPRDLVEMLARMTPDQLPRTARQIQETVSTGGAIYNALSEYYVDNLLSDAVRTSGRIGVSNSVSALLQLPSRQIAAMLPGSPVKMGEPLAMLQGVSDGFFHAVDAAVESFKTGARVAMMEDAPEASPFVSNPAIAAKPFGLEGTTLGTALDYLGSWLRLPSC